MALSFAVHVDFDGDGFATSGDEITAFVKEVEATLGMREALQRCADVGDVTIRVNNADRRFSPLNTGGPYYGRLRPGLPVRVQISDGTSTWTAFRGVTRRFKVDSGLRGAREAEIACADLLAVLQDYRLAIPLQQDQTAGYLLRLIAAETWKTGRAEGRITFSGLPAADDWVEIDGVRYTFRASVSAANDVLIGATIEETIDNLLAAVEGTGESGTIYGDNTTRSARVIASPAASYYRAVKGSAPVRYYRLGETSGTVATDRGRNGRNATYNGPTLNQAGALANDPDAAAAFDGTNDLVEVPMLPITDRSFSVECWIRPDTSPPARQDVGGWIGTVGSGLVLYDDGTLIFAIADGVSVDSGAGAITFGSWHHVAYTYDAVTDVSTLYINGEAVASNSVGPVNEAKTAFSIGVISNGYNHFKGRIDEFAAYWRAASAEEIAAHYAARDVAPGLVVMANAHGEWGNVIPLAKSGTNMAISGATLAGGADGPAGLIDFEDGQQTFDVAGDDWARDRTDGLKAAKDVAESEWGLFWAARDGTLTFRDRNFEFTRMALALPALTINSHHRTMDAQLNGEADYGQVVVSYTPRGTISAGVVARSRGIVQVPGRGETDQETRSLVASTLEAGETTVTIPFVDPDTGSTVGARDLILPLEAGLDYTISDKSDGITPEGEYDYTYDQSVTFRVRGTGSGVEIALRNTALGTLYIAGLQVRGTAIIAYDRMQVQAGAEDADNANTLSVRLPLAGSRAAAFARVLAEYLLVKGAGREFDATALSFGEKEAVGGDPLWAVEIGDVIAISDAQTGLAGHSYMVHGLRWRVRAGGSSEISFLVRRLDDLAYLVLDEYPHNMIFGGGKRWAL